MTSRTEDSGFTVVELAITMMISAVITVAISGVLVSQMRAERHVNTFTVNQEDVRQAMVMLQRDLRSSEPLTEVSDPYQLRYRVDLRVYGSVTSTTALHIRWRVNGADELVREQVDNATNTVTGTTYRLRGVANVIQNEPLFRYYRSSSDSDEYVLTDASSLPTPGDVAHCTTRIAIDLRAKPNGGRAPVRLRSDVQLRNRLPGAAECGGSSEP